MQICSHLADLALRQAVASNEALAWCFYSAATAMVNGCDPAVWKPDEFLVCVSTMSAQATSRVCHVFLSTLRRTGLSLTLACFIGVALHRVETCACLLRGT